MQARAVLQWVDAVTIAEGLARGARWARDLQSDYLDRGFPGDA